MFKTKFYSILKQSLSFLQDNEKMIDLNEKKFRAPKTFLT